MKRKCLICGSDSLTWGFLSSSGKYIMAPMDDASEGDHGFIYVFFTFTCNSCGTQMREIWEYEGSEKESQYCDTCKEYGDWEISQDGKLRIFISILYEVYHFWGVQVFKSQAIKTKRICLICGSDQVEFTPKVFLEKFAPTSILRWMGFRYKCNSCKELRFSLSGVEMIELWRKEGYQKVSHHKKNTKKGWEISDNGKLYIFDTSPLKEYEIYYFWGVKLSKKKE